MWFIPRFREQKLRAGIFLALEAYISGLKHSIFDFSTDSVSFNIHCNSHKIGVFYLKQISNGCDFSVHSQRRKRSDCLPFSRNPTFPNPENHNELFLKHSQFLSKIVHFGIVRRKLYAMLQLNQKYKILFWFREHGLFVRKFESANRVPSQFSSSDVFVFFKPKKAKIGNLLIITSKLETFSFQKKKSFGSSMLGLWDMCLKSRLIWK